MTDPMPTIMQAAERLRRLKAGEDPAKVYPECPHSLVDMQVDEGVLADFALSILPKGERPVPVSCQSLIEREIEQAWFFVRDSACGVGVYSVEASRLKADQLAYATEREAREEIHWQNFEAVTASA